MTRLVRRSWVSLRIFIHKGFPASAVAEIYVVSRLVFSSFCIHVLTNFGVLPVLFKRGSVVGPLACGS